ANSITIASTGAGFTWNDQGVNLNPAVVENGYFSTAAINITLTAAPAQGNSIAFVVDNAGALTITAVGTQKIRVGTALSAAAGTAVSNAQGNALELVYRAADTT